MRCKLRAPIAAPPPRPVSALLRKHGAVVRSYRNDSSDDDVPGVAGGVVDGLDIVLTRVGIWREVFEPLCASLKCGLNAVEHLYC